MDLEFFYNNYDLKDLEIKSIEIKNNKLIINVFVTAYLELIANGYRPEMDVNHEIEFVFNYNGPDKKYKKCIIGDVIFKDDFLSICVDNDYIKITDNNVIVKQKS